MTKLDPEHSRGIAALFRHYGKLRCELAAAKTMIKFCAENQKCPPAQWETALEGMKDLPAYHAPAQVLEVIAAQLERNADDIDLNEVLKKLPEGSPIN